MPKKDHSRDYSHEQLTALRKKVKQIESKPMKVLKTRIIRPGTKEWDDAQAKD